MIFWFFCFCTYSYFQDIGKDLNKYINAGFDVFVQFYCPNCRFSEESRNDFNDAAKVFSDVLFTRINCNIFSALCTKNNISSTPTHFLYVFNQSKPIEFTAERNFEEYIAFVEQNSRKYSIKSTKSLLRINPISIDHFIDNSQCSIILYKFSMCKISRIMVQLLYKAINTFENDPINFGTIDCNRFQGLCSAERVQKIPSLVVFRSRFNITEPFTVSEYSEFVSLINTNCNTSRKENGFLSSSYGITSDLIDFLNTASNSNYSISNDDPMIKFTHRVMRFYKMGSQDKLIQIKKQLKTFISEEKVSLPLRDNINVKYNIIKYILDRIEKKVV